MTRPPPQDPLSFHRRDLSPGCATWMSGWPLGLRWEHMLPPVPARPATPAAREPGPSDLQVHRHHTFRHGPPAGILPLPSERPVGPTCGGCSTACVSYRCIGGARVVRRVPCVPPAATSATPPATPMCTLNSAWQPFEHGNGLASLGTCSSRRSCAVDRVPRAFARVLAAPPTRCSIAHNLHHREARCEKRRETRQSTGSDDS